MKDRLCRHYGVVEGEEAIFVLEEGSGERRHVRNVGDASGHATIQK